MSLAEIDEITYGAKQWAAKDFAVVIGLGVVGVWMVWSGLSDFNSPFLFMHAWGFKIVFAGFVSILIGSAASIIHFRSRRQNIPEITLYSTGVSFVMSKRSTMEARWDSVGPFALTSTKAGRPGMISAPVTGRNVSDNLKNSDEFVIPFPKLLAVAPDVLVDELNDCRNAAIGARHATVQRNGAHMRQDNAAYSS